MSQVAEATMTQVNPSRTIEASPLKTERSMIPDLTVLATLAPTKTAPKNSHRAAASMACCWRKRIEGKSDKQIESLAKTRASGQLTLNVKLRELTDVAKELATSLAPIPKASMKAKIKAKTKR